MNTPTETMSTSTKVWKNFEGRAVGKFTLARWLGGSEHSAVFFTERFREKQQKPAAVKLISAENVDEDAQLSRWASAAKLSHPHLIRLFECGRCAIDGTRLLYVVMEYAEENLAEILPVRTLSPAEASEMLRPTAEALAYLHESGFVHGRIRPSNIMAVDNQLKISADGLGKTGERGGGRAPSVYDAPELAGSGPSPAADIWALGVTLVAVLTQNEPEGDERRQGKSCRARDDSATLSRNCAAVPAGRSPAAMHRNRYPEATPTAERRRPRFLRARRSSDATPREERSNKRFVVPIAVAALVLVVWAGSKFISHQPAVPAAETRPASSPPRLLLPRRNRQRRFRRRKSLR